MALAIMFLEVDVAAREILLSLDARSLDRSEDAAGAPCAELLCSDSGLLDFEPPDFRSRQLTAAYACSNSQLLLALPFIDAVSTLVFAVRQAGHRNDRAHHHGRHHPLHPCVFHYGLLLLDNKCSFGHSVTTCLIRRRIHLVAAYLLLP